MRRPTGLPPGDENMEQRRKGQIARRFEASQNDQIIEVGLPARPPMHVTVLVPSSSSQLEIKQYVGERFHVAPGEVELMRSAPLEEVAGHPGAPCLLPICVRFPNADQCSRSDVSEVFLQWEGRDHSKVKALVPKHWSMEDVIGVIAQENEVPVDKLVLKLQGVPVELSVPVEYFDGKEVEIRTVKSSPGGERGGVRTRRTQLPTPAAGPTPSGDHIVHRRNHNQCMQAWASTRILEVVDLDRCVVRNLVRTEMRTTTAVLNARSSQQVRHAVRAALHRNGYRELVIKMDKLIETGEEGEKQPRTRSRSHPRAGPEPPWHRRGEQEAQDGQGGSLLRETHQQEGQPPPPPPPSPTNGGQPQRVQLPDPMLTTMRSDIVHVQNSIVRMSQMLATQQHAIAMLSQQLVALHQGHLQNMVEMTAAMREINHGGIVRETASATTTPPGSPLPGPMTPERHQERLREKGGHQQHEAEEKDDVMYSTPLRENLPPPIPLGPSLVGENQDDDGVPTQIGDVSPVPSPSDEGRVKKHVQQIEERHALKPFRAN